jgi:hypothetical protein
VRPTTARTVGSAQDVDGLVMSADVNPTTMDDTRTALYLGVMKNPEGMDNMSIIWDRPTDSTEASPAPCGYIPPDGWDSKWARDHHRDVCGACGDIEADEQFRPTEERTI